MDVASYAERPWLALYRDGQPHDVELEFANLLDMFADSVRRCPHQDAIRYFDGTISVAELDSASNALASGLQEHGFVTGDRLAMFSQNDPAFLIGMIAAWKAGGIAVSVNPMYKQRELAQVLQDCGARVLLCLDEVYPIAAAVRAKGDTAVEMVVTFSGRDFQSRNDRRVLSEVVELDGAGAIDLLALLEANRDALPRAAAAAKPGDTAFLVYTSGTTGEPKGAQLSHANFVANARNYRDWMELLPDEPILAVAPLFHITGLVGHGVLSLLLPAPLVLSHRFHPEVMLEALREHRPVFTVGAITAFAALAAVPQVEQSDFASLTKIYSGGAPIAPALADRLEGVMGGYVHNAYGLTETSSITHIVPPGRRAPVDPDSGALSIGVPIASVTARIVGDDDRDLPVGEIGELMISGPQVANGYWRRPDASDAAFVDG